MIKSPSRTPVFADAMWTDGWPETNVSSAATLDLYKGDGADLFGFGRFTDFPARRGWRQRLPRAVSRPLPGCRV